MAVPIPPAPATLARLTLTAFRSYRSLTLDVDARPVVLTGANGAGKTNLIEAISLLGPGRGLRGARLSLLAHEVEGVVESGWSVAARLVTATGRLEMGTGQLEPGAERRTARIERETVGLGAFAERLRLLWLTPAMDRLFVEGAQGRRRFLDRLTLSFDPRHAARSSAYERAMRERNRLLADGPADPAWLAGLEAEMARHGAAIAGARVEAVAALAAADGAAGPFPRADVSLEGVLERAFLDGGAPDDVAERFAARLAEMRGRDAAAGRTLEGPHASDLLVHHGATGRPAAQCSTGEQKALLISLILAQAQVVAAVAPGTGPLLLLDEIAAHLDTARREGLFEALLGLKVQAWLTGTDEGVFAPLGGSAQHIAVRAGQLGSRDDDPPTDEDANRGRTL